MSQLKQTNIDTWFRMTKSDKRMMRRKLMLKRTKNNTITDTIDLTKEDDSLKLSPSKKSKFDQESSRSAVNGSASNSKKVSEFESVNNNSNTIQIKTEENENLNGNIELSCSKKSKQNNISTHPIIQSNRVNGDIKLSKKSNLYTIQLNTETNRNIEISSSEKLNQEFDESELKTLALNKSARLSLDKKIQTNNLNNTQDDKVKLSHSKKSKSKKQVKNEVKTNENRKTNENIKVKTEVYMKYDITLILSSESESENDYSTSLKIKNSSSEESSNSKRSSRVGNRKQKNVASSNSLQNINQESPTLIENSTESAGRKELNTSLSKESEKSTKLSIFENVIRQENCSKSSQLNISSNIESFKSEKSIEETIRVENILSTKIDNSEVKKPIENKKQGNTSSNISPIRKEENISPTTSKNSTTLINVASSSKYKPSISVRRDIFKNISTSEENEDNGNSLNNINLENKPLENSALFRESSKFTDSSTLESRKQLEKSASEYLSASNVDNSIILRQSENALSLEYKQEYVPSTSVSLINTTNSEERKELITSPRKGINVSPRNGVYISPRKGVNNSPRKGVNVSPRKWINTSPSKSENGDHENVNYDHFIRHLDYMLSYIFNHKEFKLLLNENQKKILENLKSFTFKERKLCVRLYYRKFIWYRIENLRNDKNLSIDLDIAEMSTLIQNLSAKNFLQTNISNENLENLLELLSAPELKEIMKLYKIKSECKKREGIIQRIIKNTKSQKLMFGNPEEKLKKDICKVLGTCVKLTDSFIACLQRVHLLFGITENKTPQEMHRFLFEFLRKPKENRITFQIDYPKLFESEEEFSAYEEDRLQYEKLLNAMESKDNNTAMIIILKAFLKYESSIHNDTFSRKIKEKQSFLRKFSSSNCIVRILSEGISILKQEIKKSSNSDDTKKIADDLLIETLLQQNFHTIEFKSAHIIQILDALLTQDLFRTHKKAEWLKEKMMILKSLDINSAVQEFLEITKIEEYKNNELTQIYFNDEIQLFLKSKKVSDEQKENLQKIKLQIPCDRFPSITVWAVEVPNNISGRKKMYKSKDDNGHNYSSVEEVAINHYKKYLDFEDGIHCEGSLLSTLFDILFWDLIYEYHVPNTFISPIQSRPLDMYSRWFYTNRKDVIDVRLNEIQNWTEEEFEIQLQRMLDKISNFMTPSTLADVPLLMTFVKSINREVLVKMLRKLIEEHGTYRAGFPDIILWNTRTKKCKFAEVKGQHDKLRPKQILWLRFLLSIGADAELCHVHTTGYSKIAQ